jgi:hypothetical protein
VTVTSCAAAGVLRFSVACALVGFVIEYSAAFGADTVHRYERLLPVELAPLSAIEPDPLNVVTFGVSAIAATTVGGLPPENTVSMQVWKRSYVHRLRPHSA